MLPSTVRKCLIILGMHRSGTSALTGALHLAGLDVGKKLMQPNEDNPKGYFENELIYRLNEQILNDLYSKWYDTMLIPEYWWQAERFEWHKQELTKLLKSEFDSSKDLILKDPRISILLPFYIDVLASLDIEPLFLIAHRNPLEISMSLSRRDHLPQERNLLLCMDYMLKTEYYSRGYPRLFISYTDFLKNALTIMEIIQLQLGVRLDIGDNIKEKINSFLDQDLKHHHKDNLQIPDETLPELRELNDILADANRRDLSQNEMFAINNIRTRFLHKLSVYTGIAKKYKARIILFDDKGGKEIQEYDLTYGTNLFKINIQGPKKISRLILNPSNSNVGLQIIHKTFSGEDGTPVELDNMKTNAVFESNDGALIFETEMPQVSFELDPAQKISHLAFEIIYLSFGHFTYRMLSGFRNKMIKSLNEELLRLRDYQTAIGFKMNDVIEELKRLKKVMNRMRIDQEKLEKDLSRSEEEKQKLKEERRLLTEAKERKSVALIKAEGVINQLEKENLREARVIDAKDAEINTIYSSMTWKTGRSITAPFRFIYRVLDKRKLGG